MTPLPPRDDPGFPEALQAARLAAGMTTKELGEKVGRSPTMISRWEAKDTKTAATPPMRLWLRLVRALTTTTAAPAVPVAAEPQRDVPLLAQALHDIAAALGAKTEEIEITIRLRPSSAAA